MISEYVIEIVTQ